MKRQLLTSLAVVAATSLATAQQITPVWLQHLNGLVNVTEDNKLPVLIKRGGPGDQAYRVDGGSNIDAYVGFLKYDDDHYMIGIRENGIDEATADAATRAIAEQYPDRSIIWIDAQTGAPQGIALQSEPFPVELATQSENDFFWKWGISDGAHGERVIYTAYKYKILRFAPAALVDDPNWENQRPTWSDTPTEAWVEPVVDEPNPTFPPWDKWIESIHSSPAPAGPNDTSHEANYLDSSGGDGATSWRWKGFRVSGSGNDTVIIAGGGSWRASMVPQQFATDDGGMTFYPIARVNERGDGFGAKGNYALGGQASSIRTEADGRQWVIQGHYPGSGWDRRPERFTKNPAAENDEGTDEDGNSANDPGENHKERPHFFDKDNRAVGDLPAFAWEAAGQGGLPIDHAVDGVERYDGNWVMTADTKDGLDYIVTWAIPSWNQQFGGVGDGWPDTVDPDSIFKPGWIGLHTVDGSISTGNLEGENNAYQVPVYETDEPIVDPDGNGGTGHDWGYDGDIEVYATDDGKGSSVVLWAGGIYGFGVFQVENVPATITQQPQGQIVTEGAEVTLEAQVVGGANRYQWFKDDERAPGLTSPSYTIERAQVSDSGKYKLTVYNAANEGGMVNSDEVELTVITDEVGPTVAGFSGGTPPEETQSWLTVSYSERVTAETAGDTGNYALNAGASVDGVQIVDDWTVMLGTTRLTAGTDYVLTLNGIMDQSANGNVIEPNTRVEFVGPELTEGFAIWEYYADIPGTSVDGLLGDPNYPDNPAQRESLTKFSTNPELQNFADNFGARMSGWITPTESGQYRFFIRSDDASELWLSTTSSMIQARLIAEEPGCCNAFLEPTDGDGNSNLQTSDPVALTAGTSYYLEAIYKEAGGGDHCEVAWRREGDSTPAAELDPIPGSFLSAYVLAVTTPEITGISYNAELNLITIEYVGILERADTVDGEYQSIPGASSPYTFNPNENGQGYFRSAAP